VPLPVGELTENETLQAATGTAPIQPQRTSSVASGHFTSSTSGSDQLLSRNGSSGPYQRNIGKNPRSGTVLTQLLSKPLGAVGPKKRSKLPSGLVLSLSYEEWAAMFVSVRTIERVPETFPNPILWKGCPLFTRNRARRCDRSTLVEVRKQLQSRQVLAT
jgi:hypothetical protein